MSVEVAPSIASLSELVHERNLALFSAESSQNFPSFTSAVKGPAKLVAMIETAPQVDSRGRLQNLVACGISVQLITGVPRAFTDLDFVELVPVPALHTQDSDVMTPENYWSGFHFNPDFLEYTQFTARFTLDNKEHTARTIHPAITVVQKLTDKNGLPPRRHDLRDVSSLLQYWRYAEKGDDSWDDVAGQALLSLPRDKRERTIQKMQSFELLTRHFRL